MDNNALFILEVGGGELNDFVNKTGVGVRKLVRFCDSEIKQFALEVRDSFNSELGSTLQYPMPV